MTVVSYKSDLQKRGIEAGQLKRVRGVLGKPQGSWGYAHVSLACSNRNAPFTCICAARTLTNMLRHLSDVGSSGPTKGGTA